ncbi:MAG: hypothetical protein IH840_00450 [Candidatus Heimdallarchaeota archaeon]|nr:hypothetical protein [Candidatus Heimdallarchaeota archaeon]
MKAVTCVLLVLFVSSADELNGASLSLERTVVYDSSVSGNEWPYGLYKRGCAVYTCNDGCVGGIPNYVLNIPEASPGSLPDTLVIIDFDSTLTCQQRLVVEDWPEGTYWFQGKLGGVRIYSVKDSLGVSCSVFVETDDVSITGNYVDNISTYYENLYVSGYGGLQELTFNPTLGTATVSQSSTGRTGLGAYRFGSSIYEAAHHKLASPGIDSFTVYIRPDSALTSVTDSMVFYVSDIYNESSGFRVMRNIFSIEGSDVTKIAGFLAFRSGFFGSDTSHLYIFDFESGVISELSHLTRVSPSKFVDIVVLDNFAFIKGLDCSAGVNKCKGVITVYDITDPTNPDSVVAMSIFADDDPNVSALTGQHFLSVYSGRIQVARDVTWDETDPADSLIGDSAWIATGTYSVFTNWVPSVDPTRQTGYAVVWQSTFTPNTLESYVVGDVNSDHKVNIADLTAIIRHLGGSGAVPTPQSRGDVNGDGFITGADVRVLIARIFSGGPAPGWSCNKCP